MVSPAHRLLEGIGPAPRSRQRHEPCPCRSSAVSGAVLCPHCRVLSLIRGPFVTNNPGRPEVADRRIKDALDQEAMRTLCAGDQHALAELMDRHWVPLVRYAYRLSGDKDAAEDFVQEAFVRLWNRRRLWEPSGPVRAYFYRIVRNLALQDQQKEGVRRRWREAEERKERASASPADQTDAALLREALNDALSKLPPRRREAFILVRFHDLSYNEVAEVMGISTQTVANQMSAALTDLRRIVAEFRD